MGQAGRILATLLIALLTYFRGEALAQSTVPAASSSDRPMSYGEAAGEILASLHNGCGKEVYQKARIESGSLYFGGDLHISRSSHDVQGISDSFVLRFADVDQVIATNTAAQATVAKLLHELHQPFNCDIVTIELKSRELPVRSRGAGPGSGRTIKDEKQLNPRAEYR